MEHYSREFYTDAPRRMTRRHQERVAAVHAVIFGMQDITLEVPEDQVPEIIQQHEDALWEREQNGLTGEAS